MVVRIKMTSVYKFMKVGSTMLVILKNGITFPVKEEEISEYKDGYFMVGR